MWNSIRDEKGEVTTDNVDTKDHERLLWATILQKNGQTGRNVQVPRKNKLSKLIQENNGKYNL